MSALSVLELSVGATKEDAKAAFRRLAKLCHPDLNPGDAGAAARFKALRDAYEAFMAGEGAPAPPFVERPPSPPAKAWPRVLVPLRRALLGASAGAVLPVCLRCEACRGTGIVDCPVCCVPGSPLIRKKQWMTCAACGASGIDHLGVGCGTCKAAGGVTEEGKLLSALPPNTHEGRPAEVALEGGRIQALVEAALPAGAERRGGDIVVAHALRHAETAPGTRIRVIGPDGFAADFAVPAGMHPGTEIRIPERGVPAADGCRGDLVIKVSIQRR